MTIRQDHPSGEILAGNPWYTDSQFRTQMRTAGRRRMIEDRWRVYESMIDAWRPGAANEGPLTILDAGCGDGINLVGLSAIIARRGWPARLIGVDYNPVRLGRANDADRNAPLQRASLYALPYARERFDVVLCSHVLEHVPDLPRALAEIRRVLKSNGLLIVGVPNEGCRMGRLRNHVLQPHIARTTDHVHFFTDASISASLKQSGFAVTRIERETFFFPLTYLNLVSTEVSAGRSLMDLLRRWFPSQAGGLIIAAARAD